MIKLPSIMTDPDKEFKIMVYDMDEDEFVEMTMDEDAYEAMVEYEKQLEFEEYERRLNARRDE